MRSPFDSPDRSKISWRALAIVGLLSLPAPGLAAVRNAESPESPESPHVAVALARTIAQAETEPESEPEPESRSESDSSEDAEAGDFAILQLGDTDPRVLEIQQLLAIGGYYDSEPSEVFDISTDLAVTRFQGALGLEETGIVDAATWERLQNLGASPETPETNDGEGSTDTDRSDEGAADEGAAEATDSDRPRRGGFVRLMLWLSASIAAIGLVGTLFYWLLRVLQGSDGPDIDDFDEFGADGTAAGDRDESDASIPDPLTLVPPSPPPEAATDIAPNVAPNVTPKPAPPEPSLSTTADEPASEPVRTVADAAIETPPAAPIASAPEPEPQADAPVAMASLPVATPDTAPAPDPAQNSAPNSQPESTELSIAATGNHELAAPKDEIVKLSITESLIQELHHNDPNQRKKAIWELGRRGDSRAIAPLVELMRDSDSQERSLILAVLTEIQTRSLQPMQQALMLSFQDESPEVRKNALRDLTRIFDSLSQMGYFISQGTFDRDPEVRDTAKWVQEQLQSLRGTAGLDRLPPDDRDANHH